MADVLTPAQRETCRALRKADEREFQIFFALSMPFFLMMAAVSRVLPARWRLIERASGSKRSIFGDARAAAFQTIPFVFMR